LSACGRARESCNSRRCYLWKLGRTGGSACLLRRHGVPTLAGLGPAHMHVMLIVAQGHALRCCWRVSESPTSLEVQKLLPLKHPIPDSLHAWLRIMLVFPSSDNVILMSERYSIPSSVIRQIFRTSLPDQRCVCRTVFSGRAWVTRSRPSILSSVLPFVTLPSTVRVSAVWMIGSR
jgi:hypothetical protein